MKLYLFLIILLCCNAFADSKLIFSNLYYQKEQMELSGLHYDGKNLFAVADKKQNHYIYSLNLEESNNLKVVPFLNLKDISGYTTYYYTTLLLPQFGNWLKSPLDLEGISKCGDDFYIVNEQVRHVLKVNKNQIEKLDINFLGYFDENIQDASTLSLNAGFEGISLDCDHKRLYIAQERSPRRILVVDLESFKVLEDFTIEPEKGQQNLDFAGLFFEKNYLYILERNNYSITKYDLFTKKIIGQVKFKDLNGFDLSELYDTGEPFGLAEGLAMSEENIYISLDNNQKPLSTKAKGYFNITGNGASLLVFKRPKGL